MAQLQGHTILILMVVLARKLKLLSHVHVHALSEGNSLGDKQDQQFLGRPIIRDSASCCAIEN